MFRTVLTVAGFLAALPALAQTAGAPASRPATPASPPAASSPAASAPAARTPSPAQTAQQQRMTTCNATAGERNFSGQARKDFMSACLSGKQTPQVMMKVCNAEATQQKMAADARKTYLASCLKTS